MMIVVLSLGNFSHATRGSERAYLDEGEIWFIGSVVVRNGWYAAVWVNAS